MCVGQPMQIREQQLGVALAEGRGQQCRVSTALVGDPGEGVWVLVHLDTARKVLEPDEAARIDSALDGLKAALRGESVDAYFADLVGREPTLPEHLRNPEGGSS